MIGRWWSPRSRRSRTRQHFDSQPLSHKDDHGRNWHSGRQRQNHGQRIVPPPDRLRTSVPRHRAGGQSPYPPSTSIRQPGRWRRTGTGRRRAGIGTGDGGEFWSGRLISPPFGKFRPTRPRISFSSRARNRLIFYETRLSSSRLVRIDGFCILDFAKGNWGQRRLILYFFPD